MNDLSRGERDDLAQCEAVIERGLATFVEVGTALLKIRDSRLYRSSFGTFEEYCQDRWGFSRQRAHQLIDAAAVAGNLSKKFDTPMRESHVSPLGRLDPAQQEEAWGRAIETAPNGRPTGEHVRSIVDEMFPRHEPLNGQSSFLDSIDDRPKAREWSDSELSRKAAVEAGRSVTAHIKADANLIEWAQSEGLYVRIDRATDWGNPFIIGDDGSRDDVIEAYEVYLGYKPSLQRRYEDLRGKVLGCWCYPESCHGDVLVRESYGETAADEAQRVGCHR